MSLKLQLSLVYVAVVVVVVVEVLVLAVVAGARHFGHSKASEKMVFLLMVGQEQVGFELLEGGGALEE